MPRKLFKRWIPDPHNVRKIGGLSFLGALIHDPNLFHINRHSLSVGFFVGLFIAFLPIPGQIPLAALFALKLRCNLPISVILVWISNPLTMPFIFYMEYQVGANILLLEQSKPSFEFTWQWFATVLPKIWAPLLLGATLTSLFFSCAGYLGVQWFWRWHVSRRWQKRKLGRDVKGRYS